MKASSWVLVVIIVLMAAAISVASGYHYLQAKMSPLAVGSAILVLCAVQLVRELRPTSKPAKKDESETATPTGKSSYLIEGGWLAGFVLGIYLFGFVLAIVGFGIAYMKTHGGKWLVSIVVAVTMALVSFVVFTYLLSVQLYPGIILRAMGY